eukprot:scaffold77253_cov60-Phaeocystis_antarctica.AAC.6
MAIGDVWLYMATSQVGAAAAAVVPINATASLVEVLLRENSAAVVIFSADVAVDLEARHVSSLAHRLWRQKYSEFLSYFSLT